MFVLSPILYMEKPSGPVLEEALRREDRKRPPAMWKTTISRALHRTLLHHHHHPVSPPIPSHPSATSPPLSILFHSSSSASRKKSSKASEGGGGGDDLGAFVLDRDPNCPPNMFVVQPRLRPDTLLQAKLSEALNLANSLEEQRDGGCAGESGEKKLPMHCVVQNPLARSSGRADKFFGPGTVENIKCHIQAIDSEDGPDAVFVNATLSGIQQRNLERAWGKPVLDRVGLIIEIFNAHAQTKEAKLQSELASLMYMRTRLVRVRGPGGRLAFGMSGEAEVVSAKGKGSGGRAFLSGAGESEIQLQRRRIQERREHLLYEIEEVRRTRALHRYARKRQGDSQGQGLATVAVVGYTNAGKSTLVSALSQSDLYSDDRLFATVDPRLRSVILPSGRKALLSDTVGFISDLPVQLVEAFHATLEEVVDADLLVHVLDSSAKNLDEQRSSVLQVLRQIGVSEEKIQNMVEVWNKIDLLETSSDAIVTLDPVEELDEDESEDDCEEGVFSGQDEYLLDQSSEYQHLVNEDRSNDFANEDKTEKAFCYCNHENGAGSPVLSREITEDLVGEYTYEQGICSEQEDVESLLSGKLTVENDVGSGMSQREKPVEIKDHQNQFYKDREVMDAPETSHPKDVQCVETSAVTGVGLQELLYIIDEKLSVQKSVETNTNKIFERKWRPSYATDGETSAVH